MFARLQVVEQVSKIYDMTVAQQKERQMKAEGLSNDMATSGSDGYLRFPMIYVLGSLLFKGKVRISFSV